MRPGGFGSGARDERLSVGIDLKGWLWPLWRSEGEHRYMLNQEQPERRNPADRSWCKDRVTNPDRPRRQTVAEISGTPRSGAATGFPPLRRTPAVLKLTLRCEQDLSPSLMWNKVRPLEAPMRALSRE